MGVSIIIALVVIVILLGLAAGFFGVVRGTWVRKATKERPIDEEERRPTHTVIDDSGEAHGVD